MGFFGNGDACAETRLYFHAATETLPHSIDNARAHGETFANRYAQGLIHARSDAGVQTRRYKASNPADVS